MIIMIIIIIIILKEDAINSRLGTKNTLSSYEPIFLGFPH